MKKTGSFCALFLLSACLVAQEGGNTLEMTADSIEYDVGTGVSTYRGNVLIQQGTLQVRGALIEVFRDGSSVGRLRVKEGPAFVRWQLDDDQVIEGYADTMEYEASGGKIHLKGNARVKDHAREIRGGSIVYDMERQVLHATGAGKGRVKMTIDVDDQRLGGSRSVPEGRAAPKGRTGAGRAPATRERRRSGETR